MEVVGTADMDGKPEGRARNLRMEPAGTVRHRPKAASCAGGIGESINFSGDDFEIGEIHFPLRRMDSRQPI
jgi:hypothetical protein